MNCKNCTQPSRWDAPPEGPGGVNTCSTVKPVPGIKIIQTRSHTASRRPCTAMKWDGCQGGEGNGILLASIPDAQRKPSTRLCDAEADVNTRYRSYDVLAVHKFNSESRRNC